MNCKAIGFILSRSSPFSLVYSGNCFVCLAMLRELVWSGYSPSAGPRFKSCSYRPFPEPAADISSLSVERINKSDSCVSCNFLSRKIFKIHLHTYINALYILTNSELHYVGCLHFQKHSAISPFFTQNTTVFRAPEAPRNVVLHRTTRQNVVFPQWNNLFPPRNKKFLIGNVKRNKLSFSQ